MCYFWRDFWFCCCLQKNIILQTRIMLSIFVIFFTKFPAQMTKKNRKYSFTTKIMSVISIVSSSQKIWDHFKITRHCGLSLNHNTNDIWHCFMVTVIKPIFENNINCQSKIQSQLRIWLVIKFCKIKILFHPFPFFNLYINSKVYNTEFT